jgi:hypothetical protein
MVVDLLKVDADTDWGTPAANTASRENGKQPAARVAGGDKKPATGST